jgi:hypothetical protein
MNAIFKYHSLRKTYPFFVSKELTDGKFFPLFPAGNHFEPPRYWLGMMIDIHKKNTE